PYRRGRVGARRLAGRFGSPSSGSCGAGGGMIAPSRLDSSPVDGSLPAGPASAPCGAGWISSVMHRLTLFFVCRMIFDDLLLEPSVTQLSWAGGSASA